MVLMNEFKEFLKEYKVIGMAIGFIMGTAATSFVQAMVANIIMPLVTPFVPGGAWETSKLTIWKFVIGWGPALAALINFLIMAWVVFAIAKFVLKEEKVTKK